ncbi:unnamed protein product [Rotaria sp. Silwood1]|nr:unnamed protein product [Rotaria sp. Silwood1]CAF4850297.1 unnamed protein product [Rotaria sp. Silwood1]
MKKRNILITGAGTGLGKGAAFELARRGHNVIAGVQFDAQATDLIKEADEAGLKIRAEKLDILNEDDRAKAAEWNIDVLINNAGVGETGPIAEQPIETIRKVFDTNIFGALALTQGIVKKMIANKKGKIIFMSSIAGLMTFPYAAAYCASKHALECIAEAMHMELSPLGIKICTINPGLYNTGFNDRMGESKWKWFKQGENFTDESAIRGSDSAILSTQYDPAEIDIKLADMAENDDILFRNVMPQPMEDVIKGFQKQYWEILS